MPVAIELIRDRSSGGGIERLAIKVVHERCLPKPIGRALGITDLLLGLAHSVLFGAFGSLAIVP